MTDNNSPDTLRIGNFKVVDKFVYLGALINNQGDCEAEIRGRIQLGRTAMSQLTKVWKNPNITRHTKINLIKTLVFSVFHYASETWTLRTADRCRMDAFEMWCWRRMLQIPWTARRINASILAEINPLQRLSSYVYSRILKFFGHINRSNTIEHLIVQGKPEGKRRRGRSLTRRTDAVKQLLNTSMEEAVRATANRDKWRSTIRNVVKDMEEQQA